MSRVIYFGSLDIYSHPPLYIYSYIYSSSRYIYMYIAGMAIVAVVVVGDLVTTRIFWIWLLYLFNIWRISKDSCVIMESTTNLIKNCFMFFNDVLSIHRYIYCGIVAKVLISAWFELNFSLRISLDSTRGAL